MKEETLQKVLKLVAGADDAELRAIQQVLSMRIKSLRHAERMANEATLKIGDAVRLKGLKPAYLNGTRGVILDKRPRGFLVELQRPDARAHRRFGSTPIVPANCLEKI